MVPPKPALPPQVVQITHGSGLPTVSGNAVAGPMRQPRPVRFPFDPASVELGSDEADFVMLVEFGADFKERAEDPDCAPSAAASLGNLALRIMREVITLRREILEARRPPEERKGKRKAASNPNPFTADDDAEPGDEMP